MVTDDGQQVVRGGLRCAVLAQEGLQVQPVQGEGHVGADLGGEHQLVSEALQVDAQDLWQQVQIESGRSFGGE